MIKHKDEQFPGFPPEPATNYWQYPRALNGWWHCLTGSEQKALDFVLRHTWGFKKTADRISYSQFINGVRNLDKGCGIRSSATLKKALDGLEYKGFIRKSKYRGKTTGYELVINPNTSLASKEPSSKTKEVTSLESKDTIKDSIKDKQKDNDMLYGD